MQTLKEGYKSGDISKEDYVAALRAHHAAVAETKSEQREEAAKFDREALWGLEHNSQSVSSSQEAITYGSCRRD